VLKPRRKRFERLLERAGRIHPRTRKSADFVFTENSVGALSPKRSVNNSVKRTSLPKGTGGYGYATLTRVSLRTSKRKLNGL